MNRDDSIEPDQGSFRAGEVPSEGTSDVDERLESELADPLARADAALDAAASGPAQPENFRQALRRAFVSGAFPGDEAVDTGLARRLDGFRPAPTSAAFRRSVEGAFLGGPEALEAQPGEPASRPDQSAVAQSGPGHGERGAEARLVSQQKARSRRARPGTDGAAAVSARESARGSSAGRSTGRTSGPSNSGSPWRLRLVGAAGLMAAAAAVLVVLQGNPWTGTSPSPSGPAVAAGGATGRGTETGPWTVDPEDLKRAPEWLAEVRVNGGSVATVAEFEAALAGAMSIEVGDGQSVRLRRGRQYVVELADRARVDVSESGLDLFVHSGAVRIATGPGFDASTALVLTTAYGRAEVVGTIFGVDVENGHACICCIQGEVLAVPCEAGGGESLAKSVPANRTRVLKGDGAPLDLALVAKHAEPLSGLRGYWL